MILRRPIIINRLLGSRRFIGNGGPRASNTPFDLKECDEKYKELNTMYEEMFTTQENEPVAGDLSKLSTQKNEIETSDIDELNAEIASIYCVPKKKTIDRSRFKPITSKNDFIELVKSPGKFVITSTSNNPYFNLALEDYVFRNTPIDTKHKIFDSNRLLLYINNKCAVIGKNQNVWEELYLNNLKTKGFEFLRRLSGGGAVLHDRGNVNYSYISSRDEFDTKFFNGKIVSWLKEFDPSLPVIQNDRGDINYTSYKISGSAYKVAQGKAYHHGTMLINSDLANFKQLLKPSEIDGIKWNTHSVNSVRSQIKNLPLPSTDTFIDICSGGFNRMYSLENDVYTCNEKDVLNEDIINTMEKLKSSEWKFHSGPKFELEITSKDNSTTESIAVEKGYIVNSTIEGIESMDFTTFLENINMYIDIDTSKLL